DLDGDDAVSCRCRITVDLVDLPEDDNIGVGCAIRLARISVASTLSELSGSGYLCSQFYGGGLGDGEALRINRVEGDGLVVVEQSGNFIATVSIKVANHDSARDGRRQRGAIPK